MRRNGDVLRQIMLKHEELSVGNESIDLDPSDFDNMSEDNLWAHVLLLVDAGYLEKEDQLIGPNDVSAGRITIAGYDFIDSVRDPEIWNKTKEAANAAGGWSIRLLGRLAEGYLRTKIKNATGIDL